MNLDRFVQPREGRDATFGLKSNAHAASSARLAHLDPYLPPSLEHRLRLRGPKELAGLSDGSPSELSEASCRSKARVPQRLVPDATSLLPRVAAKLRRHDKERVIGNPGVDMDSTIVHRGVDVAGHIRRLWILAEQRIVIRRARRLHRTQGDALDLVGEEAGADQPVGVRGGLLQGVLFDQ